MPGRHVAVRGVYRYSPDDRRPPRRIATPGPAARLATLPAHIVERARKDARAGRKIQAIRDVRQATASGRAITPGGLRFVGLKDAKDFVEALIPPRKVTKLGEEPPADVTALTDGSAYTPYLVRTSEGWEWRARLHFSDGSDVVRWSVAAPLAARYTLTEVV